MGAIESQSSQAFTRPRKDWVQGLLLRYCVELETFLKVEGNRICQIIHQSEMSSVFSPRRQMTFQTTSLLWNAIFVDILNLPKHNVLWVIRQKEILRTCLTLFKNVCEEYFPLEITYQSQKRMIETYRLIFIHFSVCDCVVLHSRRRPRINKLEEIPYFQQQLVLAVEKRRVLFPIKKRRIFMTQPCQFCLTDKMW